MIGLERHSMRLLYLQMFNSIGQSRSDMREAPQKNRSGSNYFAGNTVAWHLLSILVEMQLRGKVDL